MNKQLISTVVSQPKPQDGQKNRSSNNFSTTGIPSGTKYLLFEVGDAPDNDSVFFNVMLDKTAATDPVIYFNEANGNRTNIMEKSDSLYISNPSGATTNFEVKIYAIL